MHRYFLIPVLSFFGFICLFVIYLQFINENWKFLVPKKDLPLICDDDSFVKLINHKGDFIEGRSLSDSPDILQSEQYHVVLLLPCEMEDRKFDVNYNIEYSLLAINKWFADKSRIQKIQFDINNRSRVDVTFLRVNKTMKWFDNKIEGDEKKLIYQIRSKKLYLIIKISLIILIRKNSLYFLKVGREENILIMMCVESRPMMAKLQFITPHQDLKNM